MSIITKRRRILHARPTSNGFFTGHGGHQIYVEETYVFGVRASRVVLDEEDVPHFHYVQNATLGCSEWRSRLCAQYPEAVTK